SAALDGAGLQAGIAVVNLAVGQTYTFLCVAFDAAGAQISSDARSTTPVHVAPEGNPAPVPLVVTLVDTPFAAAGSSPIRVSPGARITPPAPAIGAREQQVPDPEADFPGQMARIQEAVAELPPPSGDTAADAARVLDVVQQTAPEVLRAYGIDPTEAAAAMAGAVTSGAQPVDLSGATDRESVLAALGLGDSAPGSGYGTQLLRRMSRYSVQTNWTKTRLASHSAITAPNRFPWETRATQRLSQWECSAAALAYVWAAQNFKGDPEAGTMYTSIAEGHDLRAWFGFVYGLGVWPDKLLRMARDGVPGFGGAYLTDHVTEEALKGLIDAGKLPIVMMSNGDDISDGAHYAAAVAWDDATGIVFNNSLREPNRYFGNSWPEFRQAWSMRFITGRLRATAAGLLVRAALTLSVLDASLAIAVLATANQMRPYTILVPNPTFALPGIGQVSLWAQGFMPEDDSFPVGPSTSVDFDAKAFFTNGIEDLEGITWSVTHGASFGVDEHGVVRVLRNPNGARSTTVVARSVRDSRIIAAKTVFADVTGMTVFPEAVYVTPGAAAQLGARILLATEGTDPNGVTWESLHPAFEVDATSGRVTTTLPSSTPVDSVITATSRTNPSWMRQVWVSNHPPAADWPTVFSNGQPWVKIEPIPGKEAPTGTFRLFGSSSASNSGGFTDWWLERDDSGGAMTEIWRSTFTWQSGFPVAFDVVLDTGHAFRVNRLGNTDGSGVFTLSGL
ncbi:MAG: hypothetical protein FJZ01_27240, partial [Candidatus Sericytochromatia bacterium]|nr:hypothetical protein [Candidatus Tanganyikabacteria bacterium]